MILNATARVWLGLLLCLAPADVWAVQDAVNNRSMPNPATDRDGFSRWQQQMRGRLAEMLGIPDRRISLEPDARGQFESDGVIVEKWVLAAEPGSRIPAVLYRPQRAPAERMPAVVLTYGHGGSKSHPAYNYLGQAFAKLNIVCLAIDPIGEEERHQELRRGTRAHDPEAVHQAAWNAHRPIMGKLVFDTMRGVDFLLTRDDVDPDRIGVAGNSLGGATAGWMAVLDTRLNFAIVSGWAFGPAVEKWGKFCTRVPNEQMRRMLQWHEYLGLAAPHCSVLVTNGDSDVIIDREGTGEAWRDTDAAVAQAEEIYAALGAPGGIKTWYEKGGGHRPYPAHPEVLAWTVSRLNPPDWAASDVRALPEINFGEWTESNGIVLERLYGTELHLKGATVCGLDITYIAPEQLRVLTAAESGAPEFTLAGWLQQIQDTEDRDQREHPGIDQRDVPSEVPARIQPWLGRQMWERDTDGPILSLGESGHFDDTHIFAPAVMCEEGRYLMLYCGARGAVSERVFQLGLAESDDGLSFNRRQVTPVFGFDDAKHSVLTPTLLRSADGSILREDGQLRMWFSSTWFKDGNGLHTLHEASSADGVTWTEPSPVLLPDVYAPTILKENGGYHMWYTDVSGASWVIRYATSVDGRQWRTTPEPVLQVDQDWERDRLFYPAVVKVDDVYLMWYGSYWSERRNTTALGVAASLDGLVWYKNPHNPVLRPDPDRSWESHYVTSQSIRRSSDGSFRIWYASRKRPPFVNKYFAINTAVWRPPSD